LKEFKQSSPHSKKEVEIKRVFTTDVFLDPYLDRVGKYVKPITQLALALSGLGLVLATLRIYIWVRGDLDLFVVVANYVNLISQASILGIVSLALLLMSWLTSLIFFAPKTEFFQKVIMSVFALAPLGFVILPWWFFGAFIVVVIVLFFVLKLEFKSPWLFKARRNHAFKPLQIVIFILLNTILLASNSIGFASNVEFQNTKEIAVRGKGFVGQNTLLVADPEQGTAEVYSLSEIDNLRIITNPKDTNGVPLVSLIWDCLDNR
jgi:hypothetical protein